MTTARGSRERPDPPRAARWQALAEALLSSLVAATHADDGDGLAGARAEFSEALAGESPFAYIARSAELDELDAAVLSICAAAELDDRLHGLIAAALGKPNASRPTVSLIARLLGAEAVDALADDGALARAALVEISPHEPFAAAPVILPRRVAWALMDDVSLDPLLPVGAHLVEAPPGAVGAADLVLVHGEDRTRRIQAGVIAAYGLSFLVTDAPDSPDGWAALVRQATLLGVGVVLTVDAIPPLGRQWIERATQLSWAVCSPAPLPLDSLPTRPWREIAAAPAAATDAEWAAVFGDAAAPGRRPSADQLRLAATVGAPDRPEVALRRLAAGPLAEVSVRIEPRFGWDDLVLPAARLTQLEALIARVRHRETVHDDWGLSPYPSPGVVALFSGPSGTGKTMAAEVLAGELGVDLFKIDLSMMVSKYIGETEKNLERVFSAARSGSYVLLFDEADALFGSRSKVSDARDRYANMEVSYLLQRLETYDGFVVLTSNFQGNIDPAFLRRVHAIVQFPQPTEHDRQRIWERSLSGAPTKDLDLAAAAKLDLAGGAIRNAAITSAYLAAAADSPITMEHIMRSIAYEMAKLGRRPPPGAMGEWSDAVADIVGAPARP